MAALSALLRKQWVWLVVGLALVVRTGLALLDIEKPGIQYDEVLFVNAATDQQPGLFLFKEIAGLPVMVFPYIGALKAWLYTPIFAVFDVRPATIRGPVVLLSSASLGVLFWAVKELIGLRTALLATAALLLSGALFWLTRADVGPSAIELACKCLALAAAARLVQTRRPAWALALVAVLALGTFNKLNFIWTVNGFAAVSAILLVLRRREVLHGPWRRAAAAWVAGMAVLYAVFGWYYLQFDIGSRNPVEYDGGLLAYTWPRFVGGTNSALSGTSFHDVALGGTPARTAFTFLLLGSFAVGVAAALGPRRTRCWPVAALGLITLLVAAQTLITPNATAPWHYVSPLPYGMVVAAFGVVAAVRLLLPGRARAGAAVLVAVGCAVLVADLSLHGRYVRDLDKGLSTPPWSPLLYQVEAFAERQPGTIVTADWGIFSTVWALAPSARPRLREEAFTVLGGGAGNLPAILATAPQPVHIVIHGEGREGFEGNRAKLLGAVRGRLKLARTIDRPDGSTEFEVYRLGG